MAAHVEAADNLAVALNYYLELQGAHEYALEEGGEDETTDDERRDAYESLRKAMNDRYDLRLLPTLAPVVERGRLLEAEHAAWDEWDRTMYDALIHDTKEAHQAAKVARQRFINAHKAVAALDGKEPHED